MIGGVLNNLLIDNEIINLSRGFEAGEFENRKCQNLRFDVTSAIFPRPVIDALSGCDLLVNLASLIPRDMKDISVLEDCLRVNAAGAVNVMRLCSTAGIETLVHFSTFSMVNSRCFERRGFFDVSHAPAYLASKAAGEVLVRANPFGLRNIQVVRPSSVYSDEKPPKFLEYLVNCYQTNSTFVIYNNGSFAADYIHVGDLCAISRDIISSRVPGVFNVGSGVLTTNKAIFCGFVRLMGIEHWPVRYIANSLRSDGFEPVNAEVIAKFTTVKPRILSNYIEALVAKHWPQLR